jgi:cytoskeletal protein RodZ
MKNNKGFAVIEGLLILVIIAILGGTGWYVYQAHNNATNTLTNADAANSSAANYSKPTPKPTLTQTQSQQYFTVKEWAVKVPIDSSVTGLSYTTTNSGVMAFRDTQLDSVSSSCTANSINVARGKANDQVPNELGNSDGETFLTAYNSTVASKNQNARGIAVNINDYYYVPPGYAGASCADSSPTAQSEESTASLNIVKAINKMVAG